MKEGRSDNPTSIYTLLPHVICSIRARYPLGTQSTCAMGVACHCGCGISTRVNLTMVYAAHSQFPLVKRRLLSTGRGHAREQHRLARRKEEDFESGPCSRIKVV